MVLGAFRQSIAATSWRERDEKRPRAVLVTETRMDTCPRLHLERLYAGREMKLKIIGTLHEAYEK